MATVTEDTITYLKHTLDTKLHRNNIEKDALNKWMRAKHHEVAKRRQEFLRLANIAVVEEMHYNKTVENLKEMKKKKDNVMSEYLNNKECYAILEAELNSLKYSPGGEKKVENKMMVQNDILESVDHQREKLINLLKEYKTNREQMLVQKQSILIDYENTCTNANNVVNYCENIQYSIVNWISNPNILITKKQQKELQECLKYLNNKIIECREELVGYCKYKLAAVKRKQMLNQEKHEEYMIQQEIARSTPGGAMGLMLGTLMGGNPTAVVNNNSNAPGHGNPFANTTTAQHIGQRLDMSALEKICQMEPILMNTSLDENHNQQSEAKQHPLLPETNDRLGSISPSRKNSVVKGEKPPEHAFSNIAAASARAKRNARKGLLNQLDRGRASSAKKGEAATDIDADELIQLALDVSIDDGNLEYIMSLKQGLEIQCMYQATVLIKVISYLHKKYPEYLLEVHENTELMNQLIHLSKYDTNAATQLKAINLKHYKVNHNEQIKTDDINIKSGEKLSFVEFHFNKIYNSKLNMNGLQRDVSSPWTHSHAPSSVKMSRKTIQAASHVVAKSGENSEQPDLERLAVNHAERLFKESLIIENDIKQLEAMTIKYLDGGSTEGANTPVEASISESDSASISQIPESVGARRGHSDGIYGVEVINVDSDDGSNRNRSDSGEIEASSPHLLDNRSRTVSDSVIQSVRNPNRAAKVNTTTLGVHHSNLNTRQSTMSTGSHGNSSAAKVGNKIGQAMGNHAIKAADLKLERELKLQNMIRGDKHNLSMIVPDKTHLLDSPNMLRHESYGGGHKIEPNRIIAGNHLYSIKKKNRSKYTYSDKQNDTEIVVETLEHPLMYHGSGLPNGKKIFEILNQLKLTELKASEATSNMSIELFLCKLSSVLDNYKDGYSAYGYEDIVNKCILENNSKVSIRNSPPPRAPSIYDNYRAKSTTVSRMQTKDSINNNPNRKVQHRLSIRTLTEL